jgi:hypothetical protein
MCGGAAPASLVFLHAACVCAAGSFSHPGTVNCSALLCSMKCQGTPVSVRYRVILLLQIASIAIQHHHCASVFDQVSKSLSRSGAQVPSSRPGSPLLADMCSGPAPGSPADFFRVSTSRSSARSSVPRALIAYDPCGTFCEYVSLTRGRL